MPIRKPSSAGEFVEPDLPITPMLDMTFQLLAFFVMTFNPAPTEGQIMLRLPFEAGSGVSRSVFPDDDKPVRYTVRVAATDRGTVEKITLVEEDGVVAKDFGADVKAYHAELTAISAALADKQRVGHLALEIHPKLLQDYVVQFVDAGVRAGFVNISPVPIERKDR